MNVENAAQQLESLRVCQRACALVVLLCELLHAEEFRADKFFALLRCER